MIKLTCRKCGAAVVHVDLQPLKDGKLGEKRGFVVLCNAGHSTVVERIRIVDMDLVVG